MGSRQPDNITLFTRHYTSPPLGMPAQRFGDSIVAIFDADTPGTLVTTTMLPVVLFDEI